MIDHAKNISLFLIIGFLVTVATNWLKSNFLSTFLSQNLIALLIALVAINTTTLSVVLTKIRDLSDKFGGNFSRTAKEMKASIAEQVILVVAAAAVQIVKTSRVISANYPLAIFISDMILVAIFSYAIYILHDTANSVFVILQFEHENAKPKEQK